MLARLLTQQRPKCGPIIDPTASNGPYSIYAVGIYIYIYIVESKSCPKLALFWVKMCPNVPFYSLFVFFKNRLLFAGGMRFFEKSCATYLDSFLTQPWPDYWLNLFHVFGPFFLSQRMLKPLFYRVFSKHNIFVAHPPKIRNTICEHNCANWNFFLSFFFCILVFLFLLCPGFWSFWKEWKTKQKWTQNNQKNKTTRCKPETT